MKRIDDKKKILLYTEKWTTGGIESFIMNLYNNIDKEKYDIDIMCSQKQTNVYDKIINNDNKKILITLKKEYKSPIIRTMTNLTVFKKQISKKQYDIIHLNIGNGVGMIYAYIAKKVGIKKIVVHSHNTNIVNKHKTIKNMAHSICKYIFQNSATDYIACSDLAAEWLYTKSKLTNAVIVNNGIDVEKFNYNEENRNKIREELNAENKYIIGHVGRFNEQKNHSFLIDIYYEVWKQDKNTMLLLVGEGELEDTIRQKVKEMGIEKNVIFYGITDKVNEILSAMDCFVLPSLFEGNPIVGVEIQCAGLKGLFSDTITKMCKITDLIDFYSIKEAPSLWSDEILKTKKIKQKRNGRAEEIKKAEYDIQSMVNKIEKIYLR